MKTGIDWKRKLTSRKWWTSIASFVSMMILAFGGNKEVAVQVTAIIMAGATVIGYTIGEGLADKGNQSDNYEVTDAIGFSYTDKEE